MIKAIMGTVNLIGRTDPTTLWETVADRVELQKLIDRGFLTLTGNMTNGWVKVTYKGRRLAARLWR